MTDTSASEHTRTRSLVRGVITALLGRGLALVTPLILIPVLYRYFGTVQYGLYATVVSLTSMFVWADLGLGNGLLTRLTAALTAGDKVTARILVSSAYSTLLGIALVLIALVAISPVLVPWESVIGVEGAEHAAATVVICFGLLFVNVPFSLIQRVQYAAHEVAQSNLMQLIAPALVLVAALVGVSLQWSYSVILVGVSAAPLVASLVASAVFYRRTPHLRPRLVSPLSDTGRSLLRIGAAFLAIQIASAIALNADSLLAAHIAEAEDLADFTATMRFFLVLASLVTVTMLPLWPANADALARGEVEWVRRSTRRMSVLAFGVLAGTGLFMTLGGSAVLPVVLGSEYDVSMELMLGLTLFWTLVAMASPFFMVQNSVGLIRSQLVAWPLYLVLSLPIKYMVGEKLGVEWMAWAGAVLYAGTVLVAAIIGGNLALARSEFDSEADGLVSEERK